MSPLRRFLPLLGLLLVLPLTVAAQTDCPPDLSCVVYGESVIEIDPNDGPVVSVIVQSTVSTITTLDEERTTSTVKGATFVSLGGIYILAAEWEAPVEGPLASAEVGDVYQLAEVGE